MKIIHFIVIEFHMHYNMNKIWKCFKNNDRFFKCRVLSTVNSLILNFQFVYFCTFGFLHFPFSVPFSGSGGQKDQIRYTSFVKDKYYLRFHRLESFLLDGFVKNKILAELRIIKRGYRTILGKQLRMLKARPSPEFLSMDV